MNDICLLYCKKIYFKLFNGFMEDFNQKYKMNIKTNYSWKTKIYTNKRVKTNLPIQLIKS